MSATAMTPKAMSYSFARMRSNPLLKMALYRFQKMPCSPRMKRSPESESEPD